MNKYRYIITAKYHAETEAENESEAKKMLDSELTYDGEEIDTIFELLEIEQGED